jgi:hypothetical protein
MLRRALFTALSLALGAAACASDVSAPASTSSAGATASGAARLAGPVPGADAELAACRARWDEVERQPAEPGTPVFDAHRAAILGRARGPALLFARAPAPTPREALSEGAARAVARMEQQPPGLRIARLKTALRRDRAGLRAALLREGYAFTEEPLDAFELVERVTLPDLFDEPRLVLERGSTREVIVRVERGREVRYERARDGHPAQLLFGDRVSVEGAPPAPPLHVDVGAFAETTGFDRVRPLRLGRDAVLAELRVAPAGRVVRAVLERRGARLDLGCLLEPGPVRAEVARAIEEAAWRRRAVAAMRAAVDASVDDALPFDRPREVEGPDRDGELRPRWLSAYLARRQWFEVDDASYPVFDADGRPHPPQVCVDFVLDAWERASGRWFRARGEAPGRTPGRLDLDAVDIPNRRGVLGFGDFAASRPDLFDVRRFEGPERVPFAARDRFFAGLTSPSGDLFRPGDVVAIHGLKRDGRVHQHAILVEGVDPLTGLPHALADQMRRPRRRTWEGIMAEAPRRSLLYRARPREAILGKLDPG